MEQLLSLGIIPLLNENDAVSNNLGCVFEKAVYVGGAIFVEMIVPYS